MANGERPLPSETPEREAQEGQWFDFVANIVDGKFAQLWKDPAAARRVLTAGNGSLQLNQLTNNIRAFGNAKRPIDARVWLEAVEVVFKLVGKDLPEEDRSLVAALNSSSKEPPSTGGLTTVVSCRHGKSSKLL